MAAHLGHKKEGGRKKGVPNKKTQTLIDKAKELKIDPFEILLFFAAGDWKSLGYDSPTKTMSAGMGQTFEVDTIEPELRLAAAKEASQYLYPKRKPVDAVGSSEEQRPEIIQNIYTIKGNDSSKEAVVSDVSGHYDKKHQPL